MAPAFRAARQCVRSHPALCLEELFQGSVCVPALHSRMESRVSAAAFAAPLAVLTDTAQGCWWHFCKAKGVGVSQSLLGKRLGPGLQLGVPVRAACHLQACHPQETFYFPLHLLCLLPTLEDFVSSMLKRGFFYWAVIRFPYPCSRHWGLMVHAKVIQLHIQLIFMAINIHPCTEKPSDLFVCLIRSFKSTVTDFPKH